MVKYTSVSTVSKKRANEKIAYKKIIKQIDEESQAIGQYICFFCNEPIYGIADHHHLFGRENKRLLDKKYIVLAHNDCHVFKYHYMSVKQLMQQSWYEGFLARLKSKDTQLYYKELKKQEKAELF